MNRKNNRDGCSTRVCRRVTCAGRGLRDAPLTPEAALSAARAAMESCRKEGYQVAVAVVDRAGLAQAVLRDRFAGVHTVDVATNKAWTAASFRPDRCACRRHATGKADERAA